MTSSRSTDDTAAPPLDDRADVIDPTLAAGVAIVRRPQRRRLLWLLVVLGVAVLVTFASFAFGSRWVSFDDIVAGMGGSVQNIDHAAVAKRVTRTFLALLVGAALGVAGCVMQGVTRNPLADPGILGVNMGAALAVVIGIAWFGISSPTSYVWIAILGAGAAAVFVYIVGSLGRGGTTPLKLALAGAATSAALVSFISAIVLPRSDIGDLVQSWRVGGVGGATPEAVRTVLPFLIVGFLICLACARGLNTLALGDDLAAGLGERVALTRGIAAFGAVMLCGAATAIAGPIFFVGLLVPHACRLLVGVDHRWLLPFSALTGAILLTAADVIGRFAARPSEVPVGIVTALIGAPFFIAIVRRQKLRELS